MLWSTRSLESRYSSLRTDPFFMLTLEVKNQTRLEDCLAQVRHTFHSDSDSDSGSGSDSGSDSGSGPGPGSDSGSGSGSDSGSGPGSGLRCSYSTLFAPNAVFFAFYYYSIFNLSRNTSNTRLSAFALSILTTPSPHYIHYNPIHRISYLPVCCGGALHGR